MKLKANAFKHASLYQNTVFQPQCSAGSFCQIGIVGEVDKACTLAAFKLVQ
jgi:hypothetical protein